MLQGSKCLTVVSHRHRTSYRVQYRSISVSLPVLFDVNGRCCMNVNISRRNIQKSRAQRSDHTPDVSLNHVFITVFLEEFLEKVWISQNKLSFTKRRRNEIQNKDIVIIWFSSSVRFGVHTRRMSPILHRKRRPGKHGKAGK